MNNQHISVFLKEAIEAMSLKENGVYVDCTLGRGGHSQLILNKIGPKAKLVAIDRDQAAIDYVKSKINDKRLILVKDNFSNIKKILLDNHLDKVDGIIYDLGVSSPQLDEASRGFSYHNDARLDMRMDQSQKLDAHFIINNYTQQQLLDIFYMNGASNYAKNVTNAIIKQRQLGSINTTLELVDVIKSALPANVIHGSKHPAKIYFQAIRIVVNSEFDEIKQSLNDSLELLNKNGRLVIITFHSLEDKIVNQTIKQKTINNKFSYLPVATTNKFKLIKAPKISVEELEANKRSRSAKLHIIERIN